MRRSSLPCGARGGASIWPGAAERLVCFMRLFARLARLLKPTSVGAVRSLHVQMEPGQLHSRARLGPRAPRPVRRLTRREGLPFRRSVGRSHASEVHAAQQAIYRTATQVRQGGCGHSSILPSYAAQHPDSAAITSAAPRPQGVARPGRANTADQLRSGAPVRLAGGGTGRRGPTNRDHNPSRRFTSSCGIPLP